MRYLEMNNVWKLSISYGNERGELIALLEENMYIKICSKFCYLSK